MRAVRVSTALVAVVLLLTACSDDADSPPTDDAANGEPAIWSLDRDTRLSPSTTGFTAEVQRLDCNSGVTGKVLEQTVDYDDAKVVVTFEVEPANNGGNADCQATDKVPAVVILDEPLGDRQLIDGSCLPGGEASTTSFCRRDGVRWP